MSDTDTPSEVAVASDGITVRKATATDEFPVPAVTFDFVSERDDAAVVRLVDAAPDDVALDDIGFNPDYGGDHWSIEDGYAVFERRLAPGEEYQTVYGVRNADLDPDQFVIDPVLDVTSVGTPDADDDTEPSEKAETVTTTGANSVGAALAAELRNDDLSAADRKLLAEEFGRQDSEAVRLSHLQSRISDIEAYSDALEAFIDDHGTGHEAIEDLSDRLDTIESEIDDLADRTDENTTEIETVAERTEANATEIESVADRTDENASDIDDTDERLDETATEIDDLAARTDENASDIDALDKGVADVQAEIEETQAWIDDLREDVEEIDAWRGRISNVFGEGSMTEEESSD
ncbi:hypothetical protein [Halococcus saccharolyticus]|uniref:Uncharacterized protein n=1 Tax=Halococcus saccharolyticus DSM 5350 TaxID=1227455 RepID=M0MHZ0_9EURY|nr:hypothetical protein [Halococcus saccharolyticus]EMA45321.1 hypothetical protein C449_06840 [Halococcus saccharolyticus DSM 5350]